MVSQPTRKTLFARGVVLGYTALAVQILYSLASIPLAFRYLSKEEFGLYSLAMVLVGYLELVEFGMTNAFQRHLFECKSERGDGRYGQLFSAAVLVFVGIGLAIAVVGAALCFIALDVYAIPGHLRGMFLGVMGVAVGSSAIFMALRMGAAPLYIHQRHDHIQFSQILNLVLRYLAMLWMFAAGWGIHALVWSAQVGYVVSLGYSFTICLGIGYFPERGSWRLPERKVFVEVMKYARDSFVVQVGSRFANTLPMLLLPKVLGLEATAVWAVCSRPFAILKQVAVKPFEYSLPMLCEMFVQGERERMVRRWSQVSQMVLGIALLVFFVGAAHNRMFLHLWVGDKVQWPVSCDWLLGLNMFTAVVALTAFGVIGFDKNFGYTRFVPLLEAAVAGVLVWLLAKSQGMSGFIVASMVAQLSASYLFGLGYFSRITTARKRELIRQSVLPALRIALPVAAVCWLCNHWIAEPRPGWLGLLASATSAALLGGALVYAGGIGREVRDELTRMVNRMFRLSIKNKEKDLRREA